MINLKAFLILFMSMVCQITSYQKVVRPTSSIQIAKSNRAALMRMEIFPQVVFAAGCAGAVFAYVYTHIDEIKAQQEVAIKRTMAEQDSTIRSVQEKQKLEIERIQKQQQDAIRKITDDAAKRK